MRIRTTNRRAAFTLIELLVAMSLAMFLMVIIAGAFQAGLETWRQLKGIGEQMEKLRSVANMLHRDLAMPHFGRYDKTWQGPFLKDQWLDHPDWLPPEEGFFRIVQGSAVAPSTNTAARYRHEKNDGEGIPSFIATDHALHFTINVLGRTQNQNASLNRYGELFSSRLNGPDATTLDAFLKQNRPEAFVEKADTTAATPAGNFVSPWAEVAYYLKDTGDVITDEKQTPVTSNVRLYTLRRRQRLAVMGLANAPAPPTTAAAPYIVPTSKRYQEVSHVFPQLWVNRPEELPHPERRWRGFYAGIATNAAGTFDANSEQLGATGLNQDEKLGDDIILTDVISFEVKPSWQWMRQDDPQAPGVPFNPVHRTTPVSHPDAPPPLTVFPPGHPLAGLPNMDFPFDDLPLGDNTALAATGARVFDTWTAKDDPLFPAAPPLGRYVGNWNPKDGMSGDRTYRLPLKFRITALQIRIRIWDAKLQQARQITIVQDT